MYRPGGIEDALILPRYTKTAYINGACFGLLGVLGYRSPKDEDKSYDYTPTMWP